MSAIASTPAVLSAARARVAPRTFAPRSAKAASAAPARRRQVVRAAAKGNGPEPPRAVAEPAPAGLTLRPAPFADTCVEDLDPEVHRLPKATRHAPARPRLSRKVAVTKSSKE
eukprot:CAMPEP_0181376534 /NCGR_PEP_ID=MMETSP1106-20121128/17354_1 /TAXON_ID=81844 /ORGANISM="Mantoniella antarctica, Strain SL-175" /LENGTH=112 /DNA_ID=CAMNT_0023495087 /DNA_START=1 /DNA_END=339 /DNA_ORIENTATION=-